MTTDVKKITKDTTDLVFHIKTDKVSPAGNHASLFCQVVITQNGEPIVHNIGTGHAADRRAAASQGRTPPAPAPVAAAPKPAAPAAAKPLTRLEKLRLETKQAKTRQVNSEKRRNGHRGLYAPEKSLSEGLPRNDTMRHPRSSAVRLCCLAGALAWPAGSRPATASCRPAGPGLRAGESRRR